MKVVADPFPDASAVPVLSALKEFQATLRPSDATAKTWLAVPLASLMYCVALLMSISPAALVVLCLMVFPSTVMVLPVGDCVAASISTVSSPLRTGNVAFLAAACAPALTVRLYVLAGFRSAIIVSLNVCAALKVLGDDAEMPEGGAAHSKVLLAFVLRYWPSVPLANLRNWTPLETSISPVAMDVAVKVFEFTLMFLPLTVSLVERPIRV